MFFQNTGTFGASGIMAPAPTMAMARSAVSFMFALLTKTCSNPGGTDHRLSWSVVLRKSMGDRRQNPIVCPTGLTRPAVQHVGNKIHIADQPALGAVDGGKIHRRLEPRHV